MDGLLVFLRNSDFSTGTWPDSQGNYDASNVNVVASGGFPSFNGTDAYLDLGRVTELVGTLTAYTISFWVKPSTLGDHQPIFGYSANSGSDVPFCQIFTGGVVFNRGNGDKTSFISLSTTDWVHVTLVCRANGYVDFYNNGVTSHSDGSTSGRASDSSSFALRFGFGYSDGYSFFGGNLTEIMIYSRDLSDAEVLQNYNCQKSQFDPVIPLNDLLVYLKNDDFSGGATWTDSQGNYDGANTGVTVSGGYPAFGPTNNGSYFDLGRITEIEGVATPWAVSFWANQPNTDGKVFWSYMNALPGTLAAPFVRISGGSYQADRGGFTNTMSFTPASTPTGTWHMITVSFKADGSMDTFLDGVLIVNQAGMPGIVESSAYKFYIGAEYGEPSYRNGFLSDFMIYSRELLVTEPAIIYAVQKATFGL